MTDTDQVEWSAFDGGETNDRGWALTYRHRDTDDSTLGWRAICELSETDGEVRFTLRLAQESLEPRVRPAVDVPGRPRIVRDLAKGLGGSLDGRSLGTHPWPVLSDEVVHLVHLLTDPARLLPVVVASIDPETGRPSIDPLQLADQLVGLVHVATLQTVPASFELTEHVGRLRTVYDGAVRLYWPGFSLDADHPYLHRPWLSRTVDLIDGLTLVQGRPIGFSRRLLGLIGDVAALRIGPDPRVRMLRRETEKRRRASERDELVRRVAAQVTIPDVFADEFDRQARLITELKFKNELLEEENERLERDVERLVRSFADVQAAVAEERGDSDETAIPPRTIREALERLAGSCTDAVIVLPDAYESADATATARSAGQRLHSRRWAPLPTAGTTEPWGHTSTRRSRNAASSCGA